MLWILVQKVLSHCYTLSPAAPAGFSFQRDVWKTSQEDNFTKILNGVLQVFMKIRRRACLISKQMSGRSLDYIREVPRCIAGTVQLAVELQSSKAPFAFFYSSGILDKMLSCSA